MEPIDINATAARNDFFNLLTATQAGKSYRINKGKSTIAYLIPEKDFDSWYAPYQSRAAAVKAINEFRRKHKPSSISASEYVIKMRDEQRYAHTPVRD